LLRKISAEISQFTADGAYDGDPTYDAIRAHSPEARIVIPPRSTAVAGQAPEPSSQRDLHIAAIQAHGRLKWQVFTDYGKRSLVETTMG
jgi:hypothetical protein